MRSYMLYWTRNHSKLLCLAFLPVLLYSPVRAEAQIEKSIVTIYCQVQPGSSQGTGFLFGSEGLIVTAYHVVVNAKSCDFMDSNFRSLPNVRVQHLDPLHDIAILKTSQPILGLKPVSVPPTTQVQVRVAGSPRGLPKQILFGRLTSEGTIKSTKLSSGEGDRIFAQDIEIYPVDVTIYNGMSGAPVIGDDQAVIGIFSGSYVEGRGIGWAIPVRYLLDLLGQPVLNYDIASVGIWPKLTLMVSGWMSLKRSYVAAYSAEHIAQLEILEQALTTIGGRWTGDGESKNNSSACEGVKRAVQILTIDGIDRDKAALTGRYDSDITSKVSPVGDKSDSSNAEALCNKWGFNDSAISTMEKHFQGPLYLVPLPTHRFLSNQTFSAAANVTSCEEKCDASQFGMHDLGQVEIISEDKLRAGVYILTKSP
jgi:hypothetical protein